MFMKSRIFTIGLLVALLTSSCIDYNKILKSTDYEYKLKKAVEYYEEGEYVRAGTLFQELVSIYRGTSRADMIYYYYAKSMMGQKDYAMATHYFKSLLKEFPGSSMLKPSLWWATVAPAFPKPRLDQSVTRDAIESLQLYINIYPYNERVDDIGSLMNLGKTYPKILFQCQIIF